MDDNTKLQLQQLMHILNQAWGAVNDISEDLYDVKDEIQAAQEELRKIQKYSSQAEGLRMMDLRIIEIADHYGIGTETDKCVEELAELSDALAPDINADHIDEELADVLITVCEQIHLRKCGDKVKLMVDAKLNRQIKRMEDEGHE